MTVVKTRQIGNSLSITIPKEFEIPQGQEYNVYKGSDGTLIFSPSKENLLEEATDELIRAPGSGAAWGNFAIAAWATR